MELDTDTLVIDQVSISTLEQEERTGREERLESSIYANKVQDYKIKYVMCEEKGNKILSDVVSFTHLLIV